VSSKKPLRPSVGNAIRFEWGAVQEASSWNDAPPLSRTRESKQEGRSCMPALISSTIHRRAADTREGLRNGERPGTPDEVAFLLRFHAHASQAILETWQEHYLARLARGVADAEVVPLFGDFADALAEWLVAMQEVLAEARKAAPEVRDEALTDLLAKLTAVERRARHIAEAAAVPPDVGAPGLAAQLAASQAYLEAGGKGFDIEGVIEALRRGEEL
jgi:hypothetical protein